MVAERIDFIAGEFEKALYQIAKDKRYPMKQGDIKKGFDLAIKEVTEDLEEQVALIKKHE